MKLKGTFQHPGLNSKVDSDGSGHEQEISLDLELKAKMYHKFFGYSEDEVRAVMESERKTIGLGDACSFMKNSYNLNFQDKYKFKGQKFRSIDLKNVKGVGAIIIVRFNLLFDQVFWDNLPSMIHPKQVIVNIENVQMLIGEQGTPKKTEDKKKTETPAKKNRAQH